MLFFWQICRSFIVMCIPFFTVFYSSNLEWWKLKLNTWSKMSLESIQYTQNSIRKKEWQERETTRTSPQFRSIYLVFLISGLVANSLYVSVTVTMLAILVFTFNPRTGKKKYGSIRFYSVFWLFFSFFSIIPYDENIRKYWMNLFWKSFYLWSIYLCYIKYEAQAAIILGILFLTSAILHWCWLHFLRNCIALVAWLFSNNTIVNTWVFFSSDWHFVLEDSLVFETLQNYFKDGLKAIILHVYWNSR